MSTQDNRLARALAALRDRPVPDGPPADTRQRTLAALHAAGAAPSPLKKRRKVMKLVLTPAAVLFLVLGALFYAVGPFNGVVPVAFAEAVEKLQNARSLAYRMRQEGPGLEKPVTLRVRARGTLIRSDAESGPTVIMDLAQRKTLILDPARKSALL